MELLCTYYHASQDDDKLRYFIWGLVGSLGVSMILFFSNIIRENIKRNRDKKEALKIEIPFVCDRLLKYKLHYESRVLSARFYELVYIKSNGNEVLRHMFLSYLEISERIGLEFYLCKSEITKFIADISTYWSNQEEKRKIIDLIHQIKASDVRQFKDKYTIDNYPGKEVDKLEKDYSKDEEDLTNGLTETPLAKCLDALLKIVSPETELFKTFTH